MLRDDLLPGGTKSVLLPFMVTPEFNEYVYASPVYGGFQIALSLYCKAHNKKATIFCAKRAELHPNTIKCIEAGANVVQVPHGYLSVVEKAAREYCELTGAKKLKFGAKSEENIDLIAERMRQVTKHLGVEPVEIWCAVGSGTLIEGIIRGTDEAIINGVCVGAEYENGNERVKLYKYHKKFEEKSGFYSEFPSMANYDLKAWEYCNRFGKQIPATLFWNVL